MKKIICRVVKIAAYTVLTVIGIFVAYALVGTVLSLVPVNRPAISEGEIVVYLERNDVHTDIVVPTRTARIDWSAVVPPGNGSGGGAYLAFGWGARDFYLNVPTWDDLTFGIAFKAVSGMGGTALHTRYEDEPVEGKNCRRLTLSPAQYDALVTYILSSGKRNADGTFVRIEQAGGGRSDAFYEGTGCYSLFFTCNSWANAALKACGQRCCLWTPLQQPIFWKYPLDRP